MLVNCTWREKTQNSPGMERKSRAIRERLGYIARRSYHQRSGSAVGSGSVLRYLASSSNASFVIVTWLSSKASKTFVS